MQPIYYKSKFVFIHINFTKNFTCGEKFNNFLCFQVEFLKVLVFSRFSFENIIFSRFNFENIIFFPGSVLKILFFSRFSFQNIIFFLDSVFENIIFFHNQAHNILRLFDVLPNFPFTTSETMGDFYL